MTAVMRAAPVAKGPRILRVGVVRDGRMVDERMVAARSQLTIGTAETATVLVAGKGIGACCVLFEHKGGEYWLNVAGSMRLRMAGETAEQGGVHEEDGGERRIKLAPDARGRVVVGNTSFLFQLIAPLPARTPRRLPAAMQNSLISDVDWFTTVVAAFSFLLHFFMVALVYSDWMDQVVDQDVAVAYLVESVRTLPPPPKLEQPRDMVDGAATAKPTAKAKDPATKNSTKSSANRSGKRSGHDKTSGKAPAADTRAAADGRAAEIAAQLAALELETLGVVGTGGPSTKAVTGPSEVPVAMLDEAGRSARRVALDDPGGLGIGKRRDARPDDFGGQDRRLKDLGDTRATPEGDSTTAGVTKKVEGPKGNAIVTTLRPAGDDFPGAARAVAGMRPRFRRCYMRGLDVNPELAGSVTLNVRIGPNGEVLSVSGGGSGGLSAIVPCLTGVVRSANFGPSSGGGGAMLTIPIRFVKG